MINPQMLTWARESAGHAPEQAAKKAHVSPDRYALWEAGASKPSVAQLRALAKAFKRPLAVFYLSEVPTAFQPLRDFRRAPIELAIPESPQLRLEIIRARFRRDTAIQLHLALGEEPPTPALSIDPAADPEAIGAQLRGFLGISFERQVQWSTPYDAFNAWRAAIESRGVLTFQFSRVEPREARAFSISEEPLPAIAVNIQDSPRARVFSLLHELTHIGLHDGGLCDFHDDSPAASPATRTEAFCNMVAGAAIVPMDRLLTEPTVLVNEGDPTWSDQEIDVLSRRFGASWETVLRRLLIAGRTTEDFYRMKRGDLIDRFAQREKAKEGFASPSVLAVATAGTHFVRLALSSYYNEKITPSDLSEFLGVRLKHMSRIEQSILGRNVEFEVAS